MLVVAHGNVDAYCEAHDMTIVERFTGEPEEYPGSNCILVTDNCESLNDYYYLKLKLRKRGVELISTHWKNKDVASFMDYLSRREAAERKVNHKGRLPFGFFRRDGEEVVDPLALYTARRIIALRDEGKTLKEISEDAEVAYPDGRRMGISTIQVILRNRGKYEKES